MKSRTIPRGRPRAARSVLALALVGAGALSLSACSDSSASGSGGPDGVVADEAGSEVQENAVSLESLASTYEDLTRPASDLPTPPPRTPADSAPPVPTDGPYLHVRQPTHDFGSVYSGDVLEHTFLLESAGEEPVVVSLIKPGCGCTATDPVLVAEDGTRTPYENETEIPPGAKLEVSAKFDTVGRVGPQAKAISIYCNDPRVVVRLGLQAQLQEFLLSVPALVRLGRFSLGESRTATATLSTRGADPVRLRVDDSQSLLAGLSVDLTPDDPDAEGRSTTWTATIELGGEELRPGTINYRLLVTSDVEFPGSSAEDPSWRRWLGGSLVIQAEVLPLYAVTPAQLFFGSLAPETAMSRALRLNSYDADHPLEDPVVRVEGLQGAALAHDDRYHATITRDPRHEGWVIELLVDGLPAGTGVFEGQLVVETANPEHPRVEVPFRGVVN